MDTNGCVAGWDCSRVGTRMSTVENGGQWVEGCLNDMKCETKLMCVNQSCNQKRQFFFNDDSCKQIEVVLQDRS